MEKGTPQGNERLDLTTSNLEGKFVLNGIHLDCFDDCNQPNACFILHPLCIIDLNERSKSLVLSDQNFVLNLYVENEKDYLLWTTNIKERIKQSSLIFVKNEDHKVSKKTNSQVLYAAQLMNGIMDTYWYAVMNDHLFQFKDSNSTQPNFGIILHSHVKIEKEGKFVKIIADRDVIIHSEKQSEIDELFAILSKIVNKNILVNENTFQRNRSSSIQPDFKPEDEIYDESPLPMQEESFYDIDELFKKADSKELEILFSTYLSFTDTFTLFEYIKPYPKIVKIFLNEFFPKREFEDFSQILLPYVVNIKDNTLRDEISRLIVQKQVKKTEEVFPVLFTDEFWKYTDIEIAQQLTLIAYHVSLGIKKQEICFAPKAHELGIEIASIKKYQQFNHRLSCWVANMIVMHPNLNRRSEIMTRFINIMNHLKKMNNFDTMYWIKDGLLSSSTKRLKNTRFLVERKFLEDLNQIESLTLSTSYFLRAYIKSENPKLAPITSVIIALKYAHQHVSIYDQSFAMGKVPWKFAKKLFGKISIVEMESYKIKQNNRLMSCLRGYLSLKLVEHHELFVWSLDREPKSDGKDKNVKDHTRQLMMSREFEQEEWLDYYIV